MDILIGIFGDVNGYPPRVICVSYPTKLVWELFWCNHQRCALLVELGSFSELPWCHISQWEGLSHILWNIKNVWNHQPGSFCSFDSCPPVYHSAHFLGYNKHPRNIHVALAARLWGSSLPKRQRRHSPWGPGMRHPPASVHLDRWPTFGTPWVLLVACWTGIWTACHLDDKGMIHIEDSDHDHYGRWLSARNTI